MSRIGRSLILLVLFQEYWKAFGADAADAFFCKAWIWKIWQLPCTRIPQGDSRTPVQMYHVVERRRVLRPVQILDSVGGGTGMDRRWPNAWERVRCKVPGFALELGTMHLHLIFFITGIRLVQSPDLQTIKLSLEGRLSGECQSNFFWQGTKRPSSERRHIIVVA